MNYEKIYNSIIHRAISRDKPDCYTEKHHITPKSMGGSDDKENIAILTAREHFIAHWLLSKIHKNSQMIYALFAMTKPGNQSQSRYTSHSFKYARERMAKLMSIKMSGENNHWYGVKGIENLHYGMKRSESTRRKISESVKGKRRGEKNHKSRKVINTDTSEIFDTITEARIKHSGNVSYAISTGGTAGGFHFAYLGEEAAACKLKGYSRGSRHHRASMIKNIDTGEVFETIKEAGKSINKTGAAIAWAIKNDKKICGFKFERLER
jgi:hypothetical protein